MFGKYAHYWSSHKGPTLCLAFILNKTFTKLGLLLDLHVWSSEIVIQSDHADRPVSIYSKSAEHNRPQRKALGNKPHKLCSYFPDPHTVVYFNSVISNCFQLLFVSPASSKLRASTVHTFANSRYYNLIYWLLHMIAYFLTAGWVGQVCIRALPWTSGSSSWIGNFRIFGKHCQCQLDFGPEFSTSR